MRRGYARGRERDDAIRAGLTPLGPGERPVALKAAAAVALLLALANLVAAVADTGVDGRRPALTGLVIFEVLMVVAAVGLWRRQYWAVLGWLFWKLVRVMGRLQVPGRGARTEVR